MNKMRFGLSRLMGWTMALGLVFVCPDQGRAEVKEDVLQIAGAIAKKDEAGAKKLAGTLAKKIQDVSEVMDLFRPRKKGGVGGLGVEKLVVPDGIDPLINRFSQNAPDLNKDQARVLEKTARVIAAVAEITLIKVPEDKKEKQKKWQGWSRDMRVAAGDLAAAARTGKGTEIQKAAAKVFNACTSCHKLFRD